MTRNVEIDNGKDKAAMAILLPLAIIILAFMWF